MRSEVGEAPVSRTPHGEAGSTVTRLDPWRQVRGRPGVRLSARLRVWSCPARPVPWVGAGDRALSGPRLWSRAFGT